MHSSSPPKGCQLEMARTKLTKVTGRIRYPVPCANKPCFNTINLRDGVPFFVAVCDTDPANY